MIYKDFHGLKLSSLGMGCMRLPLQADNETIDENKTAEMVGYALDNGVNYFDTAWAYHNGNSETVMGSVLSRHDRGSFFLATKFPGYSPENMSKVREIFEKQLEKCRTDYFDFYLFHNVAEKNIDDYTNEEYGIHKYLLEQKKAGRIRHLGFSSHGSLATIRRFLDTYGEDLEFCQIQLNYLDWDLQNAKAKVQLLNERGLPVWVMEPVRGGRLVNLPQDSIAKLNALRPGVSAPEWAFRFLQSVPGVTMTLSGMSSFQQLQENIATFSQEAPLSEKEMDVLSGIAQEMIAGNAVPCTACSYCTARCPQGLPIPEIIRHYNEHTDPGTPGPQDCLGCRSCEIVCPQGISISRVMADFAKRRS
ncbi:MAG TPA: aldo/keto reductase [Candidatus Faecousia intestinigallinarum]|nr:aldo/keto reductase [Candidatus Faecousia intestinigallinarum]